MNKIFCKHLVIVIVAGLTLSFFSCNYDTPYRDTEYPEQLIYMPAAAISSGQYVINDISRISGQLPYEGNPYRYVVDMAKREFRVPLSAYRSGVNKNGAFTVNINVNTDVIATINENRVDKYVLIPSGKYSLAGSVEMKNGEEVAPFDLIVDIDLLRDNYPNDIFALGVEISSTQRERNPNLSTAAVVIYTRIMKPTADYTFSIDEGNSKRVFFRNTSLMSDNYQWNFGDGSVVSTDESPSHTYSSAGTYTVSLSATGITGEEDKSINNQIINIE